MSPPRKLLAQYEAEAVWVGECLVHPTHGVARRLYQERHGPLVTKQYVCHTCDNPKCINDAHHFVGTCGDNVRDAVAKGRHSCFSPSVRAAHKFTKDKDTPARRAAISAGLKRAYAEGRRGPLLTPAQKQQLNKERCRARYLRTRNVENPRVK